MQVPAQLVNQVLALSPEARGELLVLLQQSLSTRPALEEMVSDEELATAWTEELDRRISAARSGDGAEIDADTALSQVREQLALGRTVNKP